MKNYLLFVFWICLAIVLAFIAFNSEDSSAILAEVEPNSYTVSFQKTVRVKEIYVVPGQQVNVGDRLLKVERPDLLLEKENIENKITLLRSNQNKRELQKENKQFLNDLEYDLKKKQLAAEIEEIKITLDQRDKILGDFTQLNVAYKSTPDSILQNKLALLEEEKGLLDREYRLKLSEINSVFELEQTNTNAEIKLLEKEIKLLKEEESELIQFARVDGAIGSIQVEIDQLVPSYTSMLSVYENNPTIIRAFTNEHNNIDLVSGTEVLVESTNRQYKIKGTIVEIGSRIIEYPDRLRTFDQLPSWGREIFIQIPEESKFLNGEKVFVILDY
ncbi:MAG: hypothetical protein CMB80_23905 [Flammeovirgaceae bacterium]|nr:hypothetical protein [Flammeovirgaceae bacterium]MBR11085.1 hypothetical protein [Rickettsiales bacterium]|tara:strand:- start:4967 stop:5959 length:993 start_codon:yes stop_codon:yes gene_type:complete